MKKYLLFLSIFSILFSCSKDSTEPVVTLKSITLSNNNLELLLGASTTLTTTTLPVNATAGTLYWSSSDSTIVNVDNNGKLTALQLGKVTITVKNAGGNISSTCDVTVKPITATSIILDKTALTLIVGTKEKLSVTFEPTNTTNQKIIWTTSNPLIVKVDQLGNIEAIGEGDANITATTEDGAASTVCKITVALPELTGLTIDKNNVELYVGSSIQYIAITTPSNARPEEMIWSSSDVSIASVSSSGLVTALKIGKATIKVSNKSGTISATTNLTVFPIKVSTISLNKTTVGLLVGDTETLTANVSPFNADNKNITWTSSNNAVASVDNTGKITALSLGTAIISAKAVDGSLTTSSCTVVVSTVDKLVKIAAKPNSLSFTSSGNSLKLSTGIYNGTSSSITIKNIKILIDNNLNKNYSVVDPPLSSSDSYLYDLGPLPIPSGAYDMSKIVVGWTVQFDYEHRGTMYSNTVAVKTNSIGQVNSEDFFGDNNQAKSNLKSMSIRKNSSIKAL